MYSRANPSPRYQELTVLYRRMHAEGERFLDIPPQDTFPGLSLPPQAGRVKRLIERTGARSILDYGAGKGRQYDGRFRGEDGRVYDSIQDYWDVDYVQCYDPCYEPFSKLPGDRFDGVICTDVLEHCPEEDIPWIVREIFGYAAQFVYATIACYPAKKRLPTGENAHCTIHPRGWWQQQFSAVAAEHGGILWQALVIEEADPRGGPNRSETLLGSNLAHP